jgi:hypothetical protein
MNIIIMRETVVCIAPVFLKLRFRILNNRQFWANITLNLLLKIPTSFLKDSDFCMESNKCRIKSQIFLLKSQISQLKSNFKLPKQTLCQN